MSFPQFTMQIQTISQYRHKQYNRQLYTYHWNASLNANLIWPWGKITPQLVNVGYRRRISNILTGFPWVSLLFRRQHREGNSTRTPTVAVQSISSHHWPMNTSAAGKASSHNQGMKQHKQERQWTYHVTMSVCVCVRARNAYATWCHLWPVRLYNTF